MICYVAFGKDAAGLGGQQLELTLFLCIFFKVIKLDFQD